MALQALSWLAASSVTEERIKQQPLPQKGNTSSGDILSVAGGWKGGIKRDFPRSIQQPGVCEWNA